MESYRKTTKMSVNISVAERIRFRRHQQRASNSGIELDISNCSLPPDPNLTFNLINVISYKHILSVRKLRFIPVPIFKNNIQKFQRSSLFAKNKKVKNRPQPGRRPDGKYAN